MSLFLSIDAHEPEHWLVYQAVALIRKGAVIVYPTDTVYGLGCAVDNTEAISKIYRLKKMDPRKPLSIICSDFKMIGEFTAGIPNFAFRPMKRLLPGPYTFILKGSRKVPKKMLSQRKTVGVRIPDNPITLAIVESLGLPLLSTSVKNPATDEYLLDPVSIDEAFGDDIDLIIDGGILSAEPSSVIDVCGVAPEVIRAGKGGIDEIYDW